MSSHRRALSWVHPFAGGQALHSIARANLAKPHALLQRVNDEGRYASMTWRLRVRAVRRCGATGLIYSDSMK